MNFISDHISPYDYILGLTSITVFISLIDMIDTLRFSILLITFIATLLKAIEQYQKSRGHLSSFIISIKESWKKLRSKTK